MTERTVSGRKRLMSGLQGFPWDSRRIPDGSPDQWTSYVIHRNILLHNWSQNKPGGEELVETGEKGLKPSDLWLNEPLDVDPHGVEDPLTVQSLWKQVRRDSNLPIPDYTRH